MLTALVEMSRKRALTKPRGNPRRRVVKVRLTEDEFTYLRMVCKRLGVDAGMWARDVVLAVTGAPKRK